MPGYNHYLDCTCGWCDKSGFRFERRKWESFYDEFRAKSFLDRNAASRGGAACFVNPNARCPECGEAVFYYENVFGSRVFFDDLGPPWPKHPCTDRALPRREWSGPTSRPTLRPRGLMQELTAAASAVGLYRGQRIRNGISEEWALIEIESILREGFKNRVTARFIETLEEVRIYFSFNSANEMIVVGDIIGIKHRQISIWDMTRQRSRFYQIEFYQPGEAGSREGRTYIGKAGG